MDIYTLRPSNRRKWAYNYIWLVVWNIRYFSRYWGCHHPNWQTHIFQRGWLKPPTRYGIEYYNYGKSQFSIGKSTIFHYSYTHCMVFGPTQVRRDPGGCQWGVEAGSQELTGAALAALAVRVGWLANLFLI